MSEFGVVDDFGNSVAEDVESLREQTREMWKVATGGAAGARIGTRNEVPSRHLPSTVGRIGGRPGGPPRALPPVLGGRSASGGSPIAERPVIPAAREETIELLELPTAPPSAASPLPPSPVPPSPVPPSPAPPSPPRLPDEPGVTAPSKSWPSRPAPDDAAAEVWALVERAQGGDSEAFALIYDRYLDTVFRFIYFRVGSRPLAEDLTADTFLRALKRIGSFTWQGRDLGAWLVTIARNLVADHFKSGRYRLEVTSGDVLDADQADRGPEGSPEAAVVDHITNVALLGAVKQLNPEQQECIVLRFLHGFTVAETAQAMGKNEGAIKALQYRAVRALHRLLPEGFQP